MSLRDEAVEAMARAWAETDRPGAKPLSIPWEHLNPGLKRQYRIRMEAALDGLIAYLREHRGDTVHLGPTLVPYGLEDLEFEDVLAVLEGEPDE